MKQKDSYLGIDFGGTNIAFALVHFDKNDQQIISTKKIKTNADQGVTGLIQDIATVISELKVEANDKGYQLKAVGIGVPGQFDNDKGIVIHLQNVKGWNNIPLRQRLGELVDLPVYIDNDVNVGALGEYHFGRISSYKHILVVFIGTGIGGGIIIDGKLYRGLMNHAGEIGWSIMGTKKYKGIPESVTYFEPLACRTTIANRLEKSMKKGKSPILLRLTNEGTKPIRSGIIKEAYQKRDKATMKELERACAIIGIACSNFANILAPEVILLGGGLIEALGELLLPKIYLHFQKWCTAYIENQPRLMLTSLGDNAGSLGAAKLAQDFLSQA